VKVAQSGQHLAVGEQVREIIHTKAQAHI